MHATRLLIIDHDEARRTRLAQHPGLARFAVTAAGALPPPPADGSGDEFDAALIDLTSSAGVQAMRAIKTGTPDTEVVAIAEAATIGAAVALEAFAVLTTPFDVDHVVAVVCRAIDHRQVRRDNVRMAWEQTLVNEVGEELRHLLAPGVLIERVLRRLGKSMGAEFIAARLLNPETGAYDMRVVSVPPELHDVWARAEPHIPRPSDGVLATGKPLRIADLHELIAAEHRATVPLRAALIVPMYIGQDLIGALSLGSAHPDRFTAEDERLLGILANQVAVAVQNARLHAYIRAGKQEWEATFDAIGDPIAVFDRHGRLLRGNAGLGALLRRPVTSLRGLSCDDLGLCASAFPECAVGRAAHGARVHEEVTRGDRIFNVTTCPVHDVSDGAAIVQIAKDVTSEIHSARRMRQMSDELAATNGRLVATLDRLKATQAQLLQAEKLSAIGQLVAGVAHELNNPLTSVIGYAQLLQEEFADVAAGGPPREPEALGHDLRRIAEESGRAARIVRNLLAFARRQSAARAAQDIADVVNRVLALRAYEFRLSAIELETTLADGLPPVLGDGGQLQQALLNLVLNAEQAMRPSTARRLRVGARYVPEADAIELTIADSGHGIPDENLHRIFDPFFTTREVGEGTGLGLSICYGIVRDHGGQITVDSRVGQGTTFRLLLPAQMATEETALRVLVSHHEPTERDYVAAALTGWGHRVTCAESPEDGRARLAAGRFDVVFVDRALVAADPQGWRGRADNGETAAVIEMTEAAGDGGVAPPYELAALRAALRGLTKEYA